ncbi:MAG: ABC transporter ATP-binding protein [Pseudomonadales bacterium]
MIELVDICREFTVGEERVQALKKVNLTIEQGEYASIMGPSGSGKSTLLNVLGLLDTPDSGQYFLNGSDVAKLSDDELAARRQEVIGFVFQSFHLISRMTALENVELPMTLSGLSASKRKQRAQQMLERTGLADRMGHRPDQLSGGQRQRVAIARSIVMQPRLLLADEPTGNLDSKSGNEVLSLLEELNQEGITLVMVTHDQAIGDRSRLSLRMLDGELTAERKA